MPLSWGRRYCVYKYQGFLFYIVTLVLSNVHAFRIGSTFMPPLFGLIANHISVGLLPVYVLFFLILMFFMLEKTFKLVK